MVEQLWCWLWHGSLKTLKAVNTPHCHGNQRVFLTQLYEIEQHVYSPAESPTTGKSKQRNKQILGIK